MDIPVASRGGRDAQAEEAAAARLASLLRTRFGLAAFRPYQEAVCRSAALGRDVLLVMPTGAGKSLCYQLPGLARGGTTLVVSPLIALMEDQVGKLQALGLAAERIHSGRGREDSRAAARAYLEGRLDFLFIAPERLAVPGFPEMLARRRPVLVAVDEAHCISLWGHDFRPEYRMLGERLPALRPAPVIALTATATRRVQDDIASQLALERPARFIHGFRRDNIAVEVAPVRPRGRPAVVERVLADPGRRPAIVYVPTRKESEALAAELAGRFPAAAYHAGMGAAARDRVQADFQAGRLAVIVATIAFGMGIDKPDVRTVVHTGLPGSLEGYYQEVGRAGRDGGPSRALLLYSWADRHTHEFFHAKNYPEPRVLEQIFAALRPEPAGKDELRRRSRLAAEDPEVFDRALEHLWIHGGARLDPEENAWRGEPGWREPYLAQREHRAAQLEEICRFAESRTCRMVHLVRHFGDQEDSERPCGICDVCTPESCLALRFRRPDDGERRLIGEVVGALRLRSGMSTGQLHRSCAAGWERRRFEELLGGLARAGLLTVAEESFEKDGRTIHYQRAALTEEGRRATEAELAAVPIAEAAEEGPARASRKRKAGRESAAPAKGGGELVVSLTEELRGARGKDGRARLRAGGAETAPAAGDRGGAEAGAASSQLVAALKQWRLERAKRNRVPAFHILHDRVLLQIAAQRPTSEAELLAISGFGPRLLERYGAQILDIVRGGS